MFILYVQIKKNNIFIKYYYPLINEEFIMNINPFYIHHLVGYCQNLKLVATKLNQTTYQFTSDCLTLNKKISFIISVTDHNRFKLIDLNTDTPHTGNTIQMKQIIRSYFNI